MCSLVNQLVASPEEEDHEGDRIAPGDMGVISPYIGQVRKITEGLIQLGMPVSHAGEESSPMRTSGVIEVRSVDGFQGREKEVCTRLCLR